MDHGLISHLQPTFKPCNNQSKHRNRNRCPLRSTWPHRRQITDEEQADLIDPVAGRVDDEWRRWIAENLTA